MNNNSVKKSPPKKAPGSTDNILNIGLDLGGDTLKIAFAYSDDSSVCYGKFAEESALPKIALPAMAFFDKESGKWLFADKVDTHGKDSFITTVKIKHLISMLSQQDNSAVEQRNKDYYQNQSHFPKFYFPVKAAFLNDFDEMVKRGMTFVANGYTPRKVCKEYFHYIRSLVEARKSALEARIGKTFSGINVAVVHPAKVGDAYIEELCLLVRSAFGLPPTKVLNSNKALALYALHRKAVSEEESFLVFDMGEETISVVQATIMNSQVLIDGAEDHNGPIDIGGNNVDEAIVEYLEGNINDRETIGTASAGDPSHIVEDSVYSKQYLLMKDVKKAKVIFSRALHPSSSFEQYGVPLSFHRELLVQRRFKKPEFKQCIGTNNNSGIAKMILGYILSEVKRPVNADAKKIFLSGGLIETYSLLDYIKEGLKREGIKTQVYTFDDGKTKNDVFTLLSYEDSVFASAVGGAIVALRDIDIKTVLSRSYGSWYRYGTIKYLDLFAERGTDITQNGGVFSSGTFNIGGIGTEDEEIYSTVFTSKKITKLSKNAPAGMQFYEGHAVIGSFSDNYTEQQAGKRSWESAVRNLDIKIVGHETGAVSGKIHLYYKGKMIRLPQGYNIKAQEGITVDKRGLATPFIKNTTSPSEDKRVSVEVLSKGYNGQMVATSKIAAYLSDIVPVIEGITDIVTTTT